MIQGIIFDFDGVLIDSENANIQAAIKTFNDINKPLSITETDLIPGRSSLDFIPYFLRERGIDNSAEHQKLYETNRANYNMLWENVVTMPSGIQETIETLFARGKKLAIATTNRQETVERFFKKFGMRNKFSIVITNENIKKRKPDPEIYLSAIKQLNFKEQNIIAIEDTATGLKAAKAAGIRCAVIPTKYSKNDDFSGADFIFSSIRDLLKMSS